MRSRLSQDSIQLQTPQPKREEDFVEYDGKRISKKVKDESVIIEEIKEDAKYKKDEVSFRGDSGEQEDDQAVLVEDTTFPDFECLHYIIN